MSGNGKNSGGKSNDNGKSSGRMSASLSVWALLAGGSFYQILAVLAMTAVAEGALFCKSLHSEGALEGFDRIMSDSHAQAIFMAALGLVFLILIRMEGLLDKESQGTLMRLRITQVRFFAIELFYNVLCLLVLFVLQIGMAFWMVQMYGGWLGERYTGGQLLFLTFYRNDFLHCLLPLQQIDKWVCSLLLLLAFGVSAACETGRKRYAIPIALYAATVGWFVSPIGRTGNRLDGLSMNVGCYVLYLNVIVVCAWEVIRGYRGRTVPKF